jgi:hypothetical protein
MYDPFEEVEPVEEIEPLQQLAMEISRSMTWDMIGPIKMQKDPIRFGQNPASLDVLEAEAREMWGRKNSLLPFGLDFPFLCYMASEAASYALINSDDAMKLLSEEDKMKFRFHNYKLGTAIAEAVVSHMLQRGLITYGEHNEFLG